MKAVPEPLSGWQAVGRFPVDRLREPRIQLHYAAQVVAVPGRVLLPREPDFGNAALTWAPGVRALAGRAVDAAVRPLRAGLRIAPATLVLLRPDGSATAALSLDGRTLHEAEDWLRGRCAAAGLDPTAIAVRLPPTLPPHRVRDGATFRFDDLRALQELDRWFGNAASLVEVVSAEVGRARPVRIWVHHFDVAALCPLVDRDDADAPCVGVGFSPGDDRIAEPYLYVTPWPYPATPVEPPMPHGGRWTRDDWSGAYLTGAALAGSGPDDGQADRALAFIRAAFAASAADLRSPA